MCRNTNVVRPLMAICVPDKYATMQKISEKNAKNEEKAALIACSKVFEIALEAITTYQQKKYKEFDALVGNFGCQYQAYLMYGLANSAALSSECEAIKEQIRNAKSSAEARLAIRSDKREAFKAFLLRDIDSICISDELASLIQSYALTRIKEVKTDENGYEKFDVTMKNLLPKDQKLADTVVFAARQRLSKEAIIYLRSDITVEEDLTKQMLSDKNIRLLRFKNGCKVACCSTYFSNKAIMLEMQKIRGLLIVKNFVPAKQQPSITMYRVKPDGLELLTEQQAEAVKDVPALVYEGMYTSKRPLQSYLQKYGFQEIVLACAAENIPDDPYPKLPGETIEEAENEQTNVLKNRKDSRKFVLDHVYCDSLQEVRNRFSKVEEEKMP